MADRVIGNRRILTGIVVSNKMEKTIVVCTERIVTHPVFKKLVRKRNKYKAHDEGNSCQIGDTVLIVESRPISRDKRWRLQKIIKKAV